MTKKTNQGLEIDPEAQYTVTLSRPVKLGRVWLRPGAEGLTLKGKVILSEEVFPHVSQVLPVAS